MSSIEGSATYQYLLRNYVVVLLGGRPAHMAEQG
jgi:hypothetical protein